MRILVFVLSLVLFSSSGFAGCYSPEEFEAEQGIRIHSELMVIGLNCAHMATANGNNLYLEHQKFTNKHAKLFARYENVILAYLKKNGSRNPDKDLHLLRTNFANKVSSDVADMRPDIFCRSYASRIEQVSGMSDSALRKWAATPFDGHPVSKPMCGQ